MGGTFIRPLPQRTHLLKRLRFLGQLAFQLIQLFVKQICFLPGFLLGLLLLLQLSFKLFRFLIGLLFCFLMLLKLILRFIESQLEVIDRLLMLTQLGLRVGQLLLEKRNALGILRTACGSAGIGCLMRLFRMQLNHVFRALGLIILQQTGGLLHPSLEDRDIKPMLNQEIGGC